MKFEVIMSTVTQNVIFRVLVAGEMKTTAFWIKFPAGKHGKINKSPMKSEEMGD